MNASDRSVTGNDTPALDPRLPRHVIPNNYSIHLVPLIEDATFTGAVTIDVQITKSTSEIVLNAAELTIASVSIRRGDETIDPTWRLDSDTERMHLHLDSLLAAGSATIDITFAGILNDQLRGFYLSTYIDDDGVERTIATSQMQSTDARRAFPCWDEPEWKATYSTTLDVDAQHLAVSNAAIVDETMLDNGLRRVKFAKTMKMSTYLVAFVVGPLEATEPVDAGGVPVRVVHRPGQGHLTSFALDVAVHALTWFQEYYDIPYPGDKVDLIAVPDFAFGAMENLGCVTFRDVLLVIDPDTASQPELQRAADVINHELAHMWFGDLVTMQWWEGIWLNEAFATFMEIACSDAYRPDWRVWDTFGRMRSMAFDVDSLCATRAIEYPVHSPEEAEGMFDILTYEKGASVLRMLEQHIGPEVFRDGVRRYLKTHAYKNTKTTDLWDALEAASGEPVRTMMDGWIYQGGHPVIDIEDTPHGVRVAQSQFTLDPTGADDRTWSVPLAIAHDEGTTRVLLTGNETVLTGISEAKTANAGGAGFFRTQLSPETTVSTLASDFATASPADRHTLVDDAWALTVAGRWDAADFIDVARACAGDDDLNVWQAVSAGLSNIAHILDGDALAAFQSDVRGIARPAFDRVGIEPGANDDDRTRERRATLVRLLGVTGADEAIIEASAGMFDHADASLGAAALTVATHHGDESMYQRVHAAWQMADTPQAEVRNLRALANFPSTTLIDWLVDEILDGTVRTQDGPYVLRNALHNREAGERVWQRIKDNWDVINERFPSNSLSRMLEGITALDTDDGVADVAAFLAEHPLPQGEKQVEQLQERQRVNAALRAREADRLGQTLT
ncbi:MAG: M1 family peptidase [Acidimicrobiaceae bacterium]|nr:M1 family peptidase [Acidimicrobiaceae bacterium]